MRRTHWLLALALMMATVAAAYAQVPGAPAPKKEAPAERVIASETTPAQDRAIERRLQEIYAELEGAQGIAVEARSGVVVLRGEVLTPRVRERAVRLARQVEGVVEVRDETELVRELGEQLAPIGEALRGLASDAVGFLPLLIVALIVLALFIVLALALARWQALFRRMTANQFLADFLRTGVRFFIILLGVIAALAVLDATALIGTALGAAGLAGLVLGFALRDTVENYFAGILLSVRQPFVPHDRVLIAEHEGDVVRLTPRATFLMTLDGNHVRIPNATVFNGIIVNYTRNPLRRFQFDVGVGNGESLEPAQRLAASTLAAMEGVLAEPPPHADVQELGSDHVVLRLYGWMDQRTHDFLKVRSEAIRLVKEAFDAAGVDMPAPIVELRGRAEPAAARAERAPAGPRAPIDIARRDEIAVQIRQDRREADEPDLLRPDAPRE
jgi:small-conductance mechanosensitive channel